MRLLVISNMAHYRRGATIVGHGATARELSAIASLFDEVRHIACLHDEPAPASALPYTASNIELVPVPPAGGDTLADKLDIVRLMPAYARTILRELPLADAVHVRCPANITLCALGILAVRRAPERRWIKYAGNWNPTGSEPVSYRIQRNALARGLGRAEVTVNGMWPDQPSYVHTFSNPCLTDEELARGRVIARTKQLAPPLRLLFVGHLGIAKNPTAVVEATAMVARTNDVRLDVVGEGAPNEVEAMIEKLGLGTRVVVHGALPRSAVDPLYERAHFVVLPSRTEGWPKVLSEGMAFGAVPLATAVGSIPGVFSAIGAGSLIDSDAASIARAITRYVEEPARWMLERDRAVDGVGAFGYTAFRERVRALLRM